MSMLWLYLATGFTGALTLSFLFRLVRRSLTDAPSVSAYFSPKGGCTDAVIAQLNRARREILVLAHIFRSKPLADALLDAKMRGVRVELIFDRANEKDPTSDLHLFAEQGLAPLLDAGAHGHHNSVILIDGRVLITGSFDFTQQSEEERAANLLVIAGHPELVQSYCTVFEAMRGPAQEFKPVGKGKPAEKEQATKAA